MTTSADGRSVAFSATLPDGRPLRVLRHAVERYHQRVRPGLTDLDAAAADLSRLIGACGVFSAEMPAWTRAGAPEYGDEPPTEMAGPTDGYVLLGDDVALPVLGTRAVTCIVRGAPSDKARERRRAYRRQKAQAKRGRQQMGLKANQHRRDHRRPMRELARDDLGGRR